VEARALQAHLGLDAGYLSRRLAELEQRGFLERRRAAGDGRVKRIALSPQGRRKLAQLERASDRVMAQRLARLAPGERERLTAAMQDIQRLLDDPLEIGPEPADSPAAQACLNAYFSELQRRFPGGFDPEASVSADPHELRPPDGQFLLVRCGSRPRGCGALKRIAPGVGEIKRMWIHPELRRRGAGRQLLAALEACAPALRLHTLRLDTSAPLAEAVALYRAAGYREIAAYNDNPYATHWFEKHLGKTRRAT
jgi:GNAT superfamily N-acetyltransferase